MEKRPEKRMWKILAVLGWLTLGFVLFVPGVYITLGTGANVVAILVVGAIYWAIFNSFWFTPAGLVVFGALILIGVWVAFKINAYLVKRGVKGKTIITQFQREPRSEPPQQIIRTQSSPPATATTTALPSTDTIVVTRPELEEKKPA